MSAPPNFDYSVHSDYLIHWTGKDIDATHEPNWSDEHLSTKNPTVVSLYLKRLRDILKYGLSMTEDGDQTFRIGAADVPVPKLPQCCFTELKLSESRVHARR